MSLKIIQLRLLCPLKMGCQKYINEIAKLLEVGLIKKEKINIDDVPKSFYTTMKDNLIENISKESYDVNNFIHKDPKPFEYSLFF